MVVSWPNPGAPLMPFEAAEVDRTVGLILGGACSEVELGPEHSHASLLIDLGANPLALAQRMVLARGVTSRAARLTLTTRAEYAELVALRVSEHDP
jgi:hypothetical protein